MTLDYRLSLRGKAPGSTVIINIDSLYKAKEAILSDLKTLIDIVEPCEPDCSEVRHAYHQGQWDMHLKLIDRLGEYCG